MKQHDDSSKGSFKSGGQRIDDHAWWGGKAGKDSVFPDGPHKVKNESSAQGVGSLPKYEDDTMAIKASQEKAKSKVMGLPRKEYERN